MDFNILASRLGMDREDFLELADLFVITTETDMEKIRKGVVDNDPAAAAAAAHSIKGAAANLGIETMAELAKRMEFQGKGGSLAGFDQYLEDLAAMLGEVRSQLPGGPT